MKFANLLASVSRCLRAQSDAADVPGGSTLTDQIMVGVERRFLQYGHRPSPIHWKGLRAIAATIEAQALGTAEPKFYLSSLPTGMGKTTAVVEAVKVLVSDPTYKQIGVVLFVNQLDQIPRLIREMELNDDQFAVRTGVDNESLNELGLNDHANAQVLSPPNKSSLTSCAIAKTFPRFAVL